jgi:hypothetical protein
MSDSGKERTFGGLQDFATNGICGQTRSSRGRFERLQATSQARPLSVSSNRTNFSPPKECPSPRHNTARKRKSDELSRVDLSQLMFDHLSENPTEISALNNIGPSNVDSNSQWRNAFMHEPIRSYDQNRSGEIRPSKDNTDHGISLLDRIEPTDSDLGASTVSSVPVTPTFLRPPVYTKQHSSFEGDSPCAVDAIARGCFSFWDRSLAWSEDDDDDQDDCTIHESYTHRKSGDVLDYLSVPKHLGVEDSTQLPEFMRPSSIRSMSRVRTLESTSRHKLPTAKCFRQTALDNVTEIHWEEKVVDTSALGMMANLTL